MSVQFSLVTSLCVRL